MGLVLGVRQPLNLVPERYRGEYPDGLWPVLFQAWERGIAIQGDFARAAASEVALAASCGWISNVDPDGSRYGNRWRITAAGLYALQHKDLMTR